MSHAIAPDIDSASHQPHADTEVAIIDRSTDRIPAREGFAFWREGVLRFMQPLGALDPGRPFRGRLRRIVGSNVELIEHASDGLVAERTARRCASDGGDGITIDLMLECASASLDHGGRHKVRAGDLVVMDYARPIHV